MWRQVSPVIREQFLQLNEVRFIMLNEFVRPEPLNPEASQFSCDAFVAYGRETSETTEIPDGRSHAAAL